MDDSQPLQRNERRWINALRWLCVLPAAYLASWLFGGVVVFLLSSLGIELRGSGYPAFVFPLLQTLPAGIAFTMVGAIVAPSRRTATATTLAALYILISLVIHIIGQPTLGLANYMHAMGGSLGALIGAAATLHTRFRSVQPAD